MGIARTKVSGGGTTTSLANLPSDWRQRMREELRLSLKDTGDEIPSYNKGAEAGVEVIVKNGIVYSRGGWRLGKLD